MDINSNDNFLFSNTYDFYAFRWGKKMHLESDFPINNGTIRVKQPGKELHATSYNHLFAMNTFLLDSYF